MPKAGSKKIQDDWMRRPRSHENMVVFTFGARKKQELPFVFGVMADLAGNPKNKLKPVKDREFLDFDSGNFDARMAAIRPRAAFRVPNPLNKDELLPVDIEFESMDDFKPDRVAAKVGPLRQLLEQREGLKSLLNYLDGNDKAEEVVAGLLQKVDALSNAKS
jgi:type VI secretion system protein ImpB